MAHSPEVHFVRISRDNVHILDVVADDVFDDEIDTDLLDALLQSEQLLIAAMHGETVIGQVQGMIQHHVDGPSQLYLDNLGVSPSHLRQGIGGRLVQEVMAWSREFGCEQAWIVTDLDNEAANALYGSIGAQRSTVALYSLDLHGLPGRREGG